MEELRIICEEGLEPVRSTNGAAGYDLKAAHDFTIKPGQSVVVNTGLHIQLPPMHEANVRGRSGMWFKKDITIGQDGTIDEDYTGQIRVKLFNLSSDTAYEFKKFDRIAQMVISKYEILNVVKKEFVDTERSDNGFGHTGMK